MKVNSKDEVLSETSAKKITLFPHLFIFLQLLQYANSPGSGFVSFLQIKQQLYSFFYEILQMLQLNYNICTLFKSDIDPGRPFVIKAFVAIEYFLRRMSLH